MEVVPKAAGGPSTLEWRNPKSLKEHPLNWEIYQERGVDQEFLESVKRHGVIVPINILPDGVVVIGHRRTRAAVEAGIQKVQVVVRHDLVDPLDIRDALIESNRYREKTNEQQAREFRQQSETESKRAELRMKAGVKTMSDPEVNFTSGSRRRAPQAREIAAKKIGIKATTAERSLLVLDEVDRLQSVGRKAQAQTLRDELNRSVNAAYRKVKPPKASKPKPGAIVEHYDNRRMDKVFKQLVDEMEDKLKKDNRKDGYLKFKKVVNELIRTWRDWMAMPTEAPF